MCRSRRRSATRFESGESRDRTGLALRPYPVSNRAAHPALTLLEAEGEGVEPSGSRLARFSRPVADHPAPPSNRGAGQRALDRTRTRRLRGCVREEHDRDLTIFAGESSTTRDGYRAGSGGCSHGSVELALRTPTNHRARRSRTRHRGRNSRACRFEPHCRRRWPVGSRSINRRRRVWRERTRQPPRRPHQHWQEHRSIITGHAFALSLTPILPPHGASHPSCPVVLG